MKNTFRFLSIAILSLGFIVGAASAQSNTRVTADIPHDFNVDGKTYEAGSYDVVIAKNSAGGAAVTLVSATGERIASVLGMLNGNAALGRTELVFANRSGERVLSEIVMAGSRISIPSAGGKKRLRVNIGSGAAN